MKTKKQGRYFFLDEKQFDLLKLVQKVLHETTKYKTGEDDDGIDHKGVAGIMHILMPSIENQLLDSFKVPSSEPIDYSGSFAPGVEDCWTTRRFVDFIVSEFNLVSELPRYPELSQGVT